ncbi:MAG: peptidoglycan bridge formation glycyltransferase FemA/FemB family protein [Anaerolineales bacterium]|jgi:lipid II:glycine glycyltransferase (peptidoglycan interpeptide bridge formation enzyme)
MIGRREVFEPGAWDQAVASLPGAHFLQSWRWGEFKNAHGWKARRVLWEELEGAHAPRAAAQVLEREAHAGPIRVKVVYVPKGPLLAWRDEALRSVVLAELEALARESQAIQVKIDPDVVEGWGLPGSADVAEDPLAGVLQGVLKARGWRYSAEQVQFRNTFELDLRRTEAELLSAMKQKTRYNVRLAEKKGVRIRSASAEEHPMLYQMYAETSARDGFVIRDSEYYRMAWGLFLQAGLGHALLAEVEGEPVAALILFCFASRAWYVYGMSKDRHRDRMPNHLLQWEAIRWAKSQGCHTYDLWGAPDEFTPQDKLWGVYSFKQGFGGTLVRHLGAWDTTARPHLYRAYHVLLPRILAVMRTGARRRVRAVVK